MDDYELERMEDRDEGPLTAYRYCTVQFSPYEKSYSYRTEDKTIFPGDKVVVPAGEDNQEKIVEVVAVGDYLRSAVPYPIEKTKKILRKAGPEDLKAETCQDASGLNEKEPECLTEAAEKKTDEETSVSMPVPSGQGSGTDPSTKKDRSKRMSEWSQALKNVFNRGRKG